MILYAKPHVKGIKWVINEYGEFPSTYSDNACRIISDKYMNAIDEGSFFNTVSRVVTPIVKKGLKLNYFDYDEDAWGWGRHLIQDLLDQKVSFNSPVWFNVGVEDEPQCSACFIQSVEDDMGGILDLVKKEGLLFKYGSGTGTNFSTLRSKGSPLSKGGSASGVLDFMRLLDTGASVIKSGGKTRRAAKMAVLNADHGDIEEFIWCKANEEIFIKDLIEKGVPLGTALAHANYQNANNSVRVTDEFMRRAIAEKNGDEDTLLWDMASAAWECGDPGIQFDDACQEGMPDIGIRNNATNPCSEFVFIDESACNLASINLVKCNPIDHADEFRALVHRIIMAMDIIVDLSSYPTEEIRKNSLIYRPLGLGYTNLAAFLMYRGVAYGSTDAAGYVETITETMSAHAREASLDLGARFGGFPLANGGESSERNAQLTLIAPTGTISFAMDCESTGIEPVFATKQVKHLNGGGTLEIIPECVRIARENGHKNAIAVALSDNPDEVVTPMEHIEMMAAAQPYLSGAISKTINMPNDCSVADIRNVYIEAWRKSLKCIAVFRDGCKAFQPLQVNKTDEDHPPVFPEWTEDNVVIHRKKLPDTRNSTTHKFTVGGVSGYLTVGEYEDGSPGEIFVNISKEGSTVGGLMDAWATMVSIALQYGVPLGKIVGKNSGSRFEPSGFTGNQDVPSATSLVDYIARWLDKTYLTKQEGEPGDAWGSFTFQADNADTESRPSVDYGNTCPTCGMMTQRTGSCFSCSHCGWNGGCG